MKTVHLYLIRGIPGSGKTTLANHLKERGVVDEILAADDFRIDEDGNYVFKPEDSERVHLHCQDWTRAFLGLGRNVAVHNTFIKKWELEPYLSMSIPRIHIMKHTLICHGEFENIHGVPADTVERMKQNFEW